MIGASFVQLKAIKYSLVGRFGGYDIHQDNVTVPSALASCQDDTHVTVNLLDMNYLNALLSLKVI